jgi:hypothetical protein
MSAFVTPPKIKKSNKAPSVSPSRKATAAVEDDKPSIAMSRRPAEVEKLIKINRPSKDNPFARRSKQSEEPVMIDTLSLHSLNSKKVKARPILSEETEAAAEALRNIIENSKNPDYDAESDPNYEIFHEWANDKRSTSDMESGLTVRKANGTLPTGDELKYIADIQPYLLAYKIHCKKFSTTSEQLEKCYPIYLKIKELIHEYRDNGIRFFRGDRPNEEIIHMVHFPLKKTKKAHSLSKQKSRSARNRKTHSRGGKNSKTSKKRH